MEEIKEHESNCIGSWGYLVKCNCMGGQDGKVQH